MTTATRKRRQSGTGFTIPYGELKSALNIVKDAVPSRLAKPILGNVLFADGLLTGTDMEMRIETQIAYEGAPMLLPHARLTQIVNAAGAADDVEIAVDGTNATITIGNGEWTLPTEDAAEFPTRAGLDDKLICRLPGNQFFGLSEAVLFATDEKSSRYALGAVNVEYLRDGGKLFLVATDGRRLAIAEADLGENQDPDDSKTLASLRAVKTIRSLFNGNDELELRRTVANSELVAICGGTTVYARLIEGTFPKWRDIDVKPKTAASKAIVGRLLHACEMAKVCTSDDSKGTDWTFTEAGLEIEGKSAMNGKSAATCDLVAVGRITQVKLDPRFVIEWLEALDPAQTVDIFVTDANSAVLFRDADKGDFRQVVMPMSDDA